MKKIQDLKTKWKFFLVEGDTNREHPYYHGTPVKAPWMPTLTCTEVVPFSFRAKIKYVRNYGKDYLFLDVEDGFRFLITATSAGKFFDAIQKGFISRDEDDGCFIGEFRFIKEGTKISITPLDQMD